ncbi:hypothetical protein RHGRI_014916 [Rhododendron griersonianum]|uniref:Uncharacterized protein n=1 Tax=Rhododendron griersonianum TaxID=479676 RepID=A0AAV6KBV6_9ERIC|nr:hypothetical protein RHGRI_014916 [Rhododendron griersonianum]
MMMTCQSSLLDTTSTPLSAKPCSQKRCSKAFYTIKCSRAFLLPCSGLIRPSCCRCLRTPPPFFPTIDQPVLLTDIVKKKNLGQLIAQYNGVEGLASHLNTNLDGGIDGDDEDV